MECLPFQYVDCRLGFTCFGVFTFLSLLNATEGFTCYGVFTFFSLLTAAGSLAIPAVPSSSVVAVLIVLSSLDIQVHNIGIVLALEWYK